MKAEVYRVAGCYRLRIWVATNGWPRVLDDPLITGVVVTKGPDRADNWIAERIGPGDIAVTAEVPLADRCIKRGARVIAPNGRPFTEASIGADLATRNFISPLRAAGESFFVPRS